MKEWSADYSNDPYDDYNLTIEILYDQTDVVAIIRQKPEGLVMTWYPQDKKLEMPVEWISGLLLDAKKNLIPCASDDSTD